MSGLCQVPCTAATAAADCDQTQGFVGCFNGACASTCAVNDDPCPGEQSCTSLPLLEELLGENVGVCMQECDENSCPDGEVCLRGFCAQSCDATDPTSCVDGQTCVAGACLPDDIAESAGTNPTTTESATDTEDAEAGSQGDTE